MSEKRYQECSWFEKRWRDRHLIPVIPLAIKDYFIAVWECPEQALSGGWREFHACWSIRRGLADLHRNYWWTMDELKEFERGTK
ncbi:MAG: hypothetical protein E6R03_11790 [Hyphomicrobiaceae bacterium]|nr:MAG: hypothetical protein E6R03_11790 [Hyphomicrobiaceae bacterium]